MTIYDIAKEAGVSASTVSRVINNKKGVNKETRRQIEELLKKYRFEPDASARGLVNQSSKMIGVLMSDIRTLHHAEGAYFIEQQLQKYGYSCIMMNSGFSDAQRAEGIRTLCARRAEAVVLIGSTFQSEGVRNAISAYISDLPVIIENGYIDLPNVYGVLADEQNGIASCVELLAQKGRRQIAFINKGDTPSNRLKIAGFLQAAPQVEGTGTQHSRILWTDITDDWEAGYSATNQLLDAQPQTDGIIYTTDTIACGGVRALLDRGIRVPGQISVIGVDNSTYARICTPKLTSLDNKLQQLSITCSDLLIRVLSGEDVPHKMMIFSNIAERETT